MTTNRGWMVPGCLLAWLAWAGEAPAQPTIRNFLFKNPSMEVSRAFLNENEGGVPPPDWSSCLTGSSPDVQPGAFGVTTPPSDGISYVSLICREDGTYEAMGQPLAQPLRKDAGYCFSIDLAFNDAAGGTLVRRPNLLRIWGGGQCAQTELLWTSPPVGHTDWRTYQVCFVPGRDHTHILFDAYYAGLPSYRGRVLLDNLSAVEWVEPWQQEVCVDDSVWISGRPAGAGAGWQTVWKANGVLVQDAETDGQWISRAGVYPLEITDPARGRTYRTRLTVTEKECESVFKIPNVFTPDGNGVNDTFEIQGILPGRWRLEIYNRWGRQVYAADGYDDEWAGEPGVSGVYYYQLRDSGGGRTYRGWVQVLRLD